MMKQEGKAGTNESNPLQASVIRAHLGVLLTNLFFAGNYSQVKAISPAFIGPYGLNVLRAGIAVVLFWTLWLFGKTSAGILRRHWGRFALCGLTGICINQMLFIKGLTLTSTIHAALLALVTPIVVTLFALWILKERFTLTNALGLSLGIGGAVFLILQREAGQHATNYLLGDVLIVINAISYSVYFILVKPLMREYSTLHVTRWILPSGFFCCFRLVRSKHWQSNGTCLAGNRLFPCCTLPFLEPFSLTISMQTAFRSWVPRLPVLTSIRNQYLRWPLPFCFSTSKSPGRRSFRRYSFLPVCTWLT